MDKLPKHQKRALVILIMIAFFSIVVRLLINYNFDKSALLYVGVPFCISLLLVQFKTNDPDITWVDSSHAYATNQAQALVEWMDAFFGDQTYNLEQAESYLRLEFIEDWDQDDGNKFKVRLRGKVQNN